MNKRLQVFFSAVCAALLSCTVLVTSAGAVGKIDEGTSPYVFLVPAGDAAILPCPADFHYKLAENYTPSSSSVKFTYHSTASYINDWQKGQFASIELYNPTVVKFYDKNDNYIKSANLKRDTSVITDPLWRPFSSASGTDIATVNTKPAKATAQFSIFCPEALYSHHGVEASVTCS